MKYNDSSTVAVPGAKKLANRNLYRSTGKSSARKKWENENWEKEVTVRTFDNKPMMRKVVLTACGVDENAVSFFRMSEHGSEKMEWNSLSNSHKKAFNEVINSFAETEKVPVTAMHYAGGYSFAYADEEVVFSAVCIASESKLALFYKESEA